MSEAKKCPKCGGEMEEGYLIRIDSAKRIVWRKPGLSGIKTHGISGYKCAKCGYLELFVEK